MKENYKNKFSNIEKSIKTNYKQRIKRNNSKPNISRTKYFINNNQINENEKFMNNNILNNENYDHNYNKDYYYKEYSTYNPSNNCSFLRGNLYNLKNKFCNNTKRVIDSNYQEAKPYKRQLNNYYNPKDEWTEMLYHPTKNKNLSNKVINSKTYQSNIFPKDDLPSEKIRHTKETKYSDRLHKTQITTLPGCIKRGKNDIKDDKYFGMRNTESYLYKVEHDFNSNVPFGPFNKEEEKVEMNFPVEQRYHGSYQRGVKDNDIFNINDTEIKQNSIIHGKKFFKNISAFKSQIVFV